MENFLALAPIIAIGIVIFVTMRLLRQSSPAAVTQPRSDLDVRARSMYMEIENAIEADDTENARAAVLSVLRRHHEAGNFRPVEQGALQAFAYGPNGEPTMAILIRHAIDKLNPEHLESRRASA